MTCRNWKESQQFLPWLYVRYADKSHSVIACLCFPFATLPTCRLILSEGGGGGGGGFCEILCTCEHVYTNINLRITPYYYNINIEEQKLMLHPNIDDDDDDDNYLDNDNVSSNMFVLVGCLTFQQHDSVSQGRICSDNCMCYHTEIEVADQTFHLTQSQYTDTWPASPSADPITLVAWWGSHRSANF